MSVTAATQGRAVLGRCNLAAPAVVGDTGVVPPLTTAAPARRHLGLLKSCPGLSDHGLLTFAAKILHPPVNTPNHCSRGQM